MTFFRVLWIELFGTLDERHQLWYTQCVLPPKPVQRKEK